MQEVLSEYLEGGRSTAFVAIILIYRCVAEKKGGL